MMKKNCDILSHCNLFDLRFVGIPWIYNNNQEGEKECPCALGSCGGVSKLVFYVPSMPGISYYIVQIGSLSFAYLNIWLLFIKACTL